MQKRNTFIERIIGQNYHHNIMVLFIAIIMIVITGCDESLSE